MRTPICDQLGIEFPLFAFSHCRDVVVEVSKAGGFGVLGALAFDAEQLEVELSWIDDHIGGRPYGVDFAMPAKYVGQGGGEAASLASLSEMIPAEHRAFVAKLLDEHGIPPLATEAAPMRMKAAGLNVDAEGPGQVEVTLKHPARMIVNALGPPPEYVVEQAHAHGVLVGALSGSPRHAQKNIDIGVDVIVAQGTEAGGHTGEISTMVLVPDIVDAVGLDVPVLAAGGIGTGRQMAAALALGAQGAWTGSIWLTVAEANTSPEAVENLLAAGSRDAIRSRSMTGKPARQIRTTWVDAWERADTPDPLPMPLQGILFGEGARRWTRARSREFAGSPAGQIVGRMDRVRPGREVVADIIAEWIATTERMAALLADD